MERTEIPGYVYTGDLNVVDYGGKWIGITRETCGEIIEVIGAGEDFGGRHALRVTTDTEAIEQANRWAR